MDLNLNGIVLKYKNLKVLNNDNHYSYAINAIKNLNNELFILAYFNEGTINNPNSISQKSLIKCTSDPSNYETDCTKINLNKIEIKNYPIIESQEKLLIINAAGYILVGINDYIIDSISFKTGFINYFGKISSSSMNSF